MCLQTPRGNESAPKGHGDGEMTESCVFSGKVNRFFDILLGVFKM